MKGKKSIAVNFMQASISPNWNDVTVTMENKPSFAVVVSNRLIPLICVCYQAISIIKTGISKQLSELLVYLFFIKDVAYAKKYILLCKTSV